MTVAFCLTTGNDIASYDDEFAITNNGGNSIIGWILLDFDYYDDYPMPAGTEYALYVGAGDGHAYIGVGSSNPYPNGEFYHLHEQYDQYDEYICEPNLDAAFRTFVL